MTETTYIYDKKEYKKTGRIATKIVKQGGKEVPKQLIEIKPVNVPEEQKEFDIWVDPKELFEVTGQ
jgi:hypothetical protein